MASVAITEDERREVRAHLQHRYKNVFTNAAIEGHLADYVGFTFAEAMVPVLALTLQQGARILDVGSGFGSFVLLAREHGFDARGIELAPFEVEFARRRLRRLRPADDQREVYREGDASALDLPPESLDAVTLWNVIEHIPEARRVLSAAGRMLRPGGRLYLICPNYAAFRQEAHYHVPWYPLLPRPLASRYLRRLGREPSYFENEIFYRTNWGILRLLRQTGFEPYDLTGTKPMRLDPRAVWRRPKEFLDFYNPMRESVALSAQRPGASVR
jgi:SAM-dependent methyltransferase